MVYLAAYLAGGSGGVGSPLRPDQPPAPLAGSDPDYDRAGDAADGHPARPGDGFHFPVPVYDRGVCVTTRRQRVLLLGLLAVLLAEAARYLLFDVVRLRVDAWINPWLDPSGRSYQIVQSLIAVANGGLFGGVPGWAAQAWCPSPIPILSSPPWPRRPGWRGRSGSSSCWRCRSARPAHRPQAESRFQRYL